MYLLKVADYAPFVHRGDFHMRKLTYLGNYVLFCCLVVTESSCHGGRNKPRSALVVSEKTSSARRHSGLDILLKLGFLNILRFTAVMKSNQVTECGSLVIHICKPNIWQERNGLENDRDANWTRLNGQLNIIEKPRLRGYLSIVSIEPLGVIQNPRDRHKHCAPMTQMIRSRKGVVPIVRLKLV